MKKMAAFALVLCLALCSASALAAGKLTVNQETYYAAEGYSFIGYIFAEVENTGDKNIEFSDGILEILSADGEPTDSATIYSMYPNVLAPGERGYVYAYEYVDEAEKLEDIADYTLTLVGKSTSEEAAVRLDCTAEYKTLTTSWGTEYQAVVLTVTNATDATVYDFYGAVALYDAEGKLLYVDSDIAYNMGLPAGQSVEFVMVLDSDIQGIWEKEGTTPATAESIAFVE